MRDTCAIVLSSKELCSNELLRPTSNLPENGDTSDKLEQLASDSNPFVATFKLMSTLD